MRSHGRVARPILGLGPAGPALRAVQNRSRRFCRAKRQDADFAPIKKPVGFPRRADFLIEHCPGGSLSACVTDIYFTRLKRWSLRPGPNLKGPRVNPRVGSFLTPAAKFAAANTRARVDLRISASLSSASIGVCASPAALSRKSYRFQLDFV